MGRRTIGSILMLISLFLPPPPALPYSDSGEEEVHDLGQIQVTAEGKSEELYYSPTSTTIDLDEYQTIDIPQNVGDYLKDLIIFDFRGETDLVPDNDSFQMRGFDANRFVTALDGLNLRKTGGRKSSNIVDYTYLPPFLIDKIEVLPGPHSALYPAKAIGGIVNFITRRPRIHEDLEPDITVSSSYASFNTHNENIYAQGSVKSLTYDVGYQKYATDGFLRNSDADIDTVFGRLGYVLPYAGHVTFSASYSDSDRSIPVVNDPKDATSDYDDDFPNVSSDAALFRNWQEPTWDGIAMSYRFHYRQPTRIGNLAADAYYSEEQKDRAYFDWVNAANHALGTRVVSMDTRFYQQGAKVLDEIHVSDRHVTTIEGDMEQCFDGDNNEGNKDKRIELFGAGLQHQWKILPRLTLAGGVRFEDVNIRVGNTTATGRYITGQPDWIERKWNNWLPKSFLTYELDDLGASLRDTSVSVGVSRIWRAPDYHGDYNPQGRPTGAWLDPEHGVGLDVVLMRRLLGDIDMKLNYSYFSIKDFIASNSQFAKFTPSRTNVVTPGLEYKDYKINLEEMIRHGIELELSGHLTEKLHFYLGYAFQHFENQGDEHAGETEADDRARHRVNAGLRYSLLKNTMLLLDYQFQDRQVIEVAEQVNTDEWMFRSVAIDDFHLVDFGIQQTLFENLGFLKHGALRLFVRNLFDVRFQDTNGFPGTERVFGIGLSFKM